MKYEPTDDTWEHLLARLNSAIKTEFHADEVHGPTYVTLQVVGLPRSGTTLLMQHLAASKRFGYPSNILALFWKAPWIGAHIQRRLAINTSSSFHSLIGRTPEPLDPHEFGYFWRNALGHKSNSLEPTAPRLPAAELRRQLDLVTEAFGMPTVYKNFLAPVHVSYLRKVGNQKFIVISRPMQDVAASILGARRKLDLGPNHWLGPAPPRPWPTFQSEIDLVAYQVVASQRQLDGSNLANAPDTLAITYADLCREPQVILQKALAHAGIEADRTPDPPTFEVRNPFESLAEREATLLSARIEHHKEAMANG